MEVIASKVLRVKMFDVKKIRENENCGYIDNKSGHEKYGVIK